MVLGTAVVIHGGYWMAQIGLETGGDIEVSPLSDGGTASVCNFFQTHGFAVVQLEYRLTEQNGGGAAAAEGAKRFTGVLDVVCLAES